MLVVELSLGQIPELLLLNKADRVDAEVGQALASVVMLIGFTIIAVPTGIVTSEMSRERGQRISTQVCPMCAAEGHDTGANYCKECGAHL